MMKTTSSTETTKAVLQYHSAPGEHPKTSRDLWLFAILSLPGVLGPFLPQTFDDVPVKNLMDFYAALQSGTLDMTEVGGAFIALPTFVPLVLVLWRLMLARGGRGATWARVIVWTATASATLSTVGLGVIFFLMTSGIPFSERIRMFPFQVWFAALLVLLIGCVLLLILRTRGATADPIATMAALTAFVSAVVFYFIYEDPHIGSHVAMYVAVVGIVEFLWLFYRSDRRIRA